MLGSLARGFSLPSCRALYLHSPSLTSLTRPLSTSCSLQAKRKFPVGALKFRHEQQQQTSRTDLAQKVESGT